MSGHSKAVRHNVIDHYDIEFFPAKITFEVKDSKAVPGSLDAGRAIVDFAIRDASNNHGSIYLGYRFTDPEDVIRDLEQYKKAIEAAIDTIKGEWNAE